MSFLFEMQNENLRKLEHTLHTSPEEDDYHIIATSKNRGCAQEHLASSSSPLQQGCTESCEEENECRVTFDRNLSFGNRGSDSDMDDSLWQSLPKDVLDKVLSWLPVESCFRFRCVCKRWCSLMCSKRFFELQSNNVKDETWVLAFGEPPQHGLKCEGLVYDPSRNKTLTLEFPFLPQNSVPVAAAGGLVCFCCDLNNSGENDVSFYVCNPITKAWKFIPSQCSRVSIVTLITETEPGSNGYKLFVFCEASVVRWLWLGVLDHSAKEYDSKSNRWKEVGDVHSGEQFKLGSVFSRGQIHLLSSETVQALDVQKGIWAEFDAPAYASCAKIVECRGRLLVVGDMVHLNVFHLPNVKSYVGIVVWEFDPAVKDWNEVSRMPEALVETFPYSSFSCVVVDDLIYMFSRIESIPQIVVFSFSQQLWSQATNWCKEVPSRVFSFAPRLDALCMELPKDMCSYRYLEDKEHRMRHHLLG